MPIPQTTPGAHRQLDKEWGRFLRVFCESRRRVPAGVVIQYGDWPRTFHAGFYMLARACHRARNPGRSAHYREARQNRYGRTLGCSEILMNQPFECPSRKTFVHS